MFFLSKIARSRSPARSPALGTNLYGATPDDEVPGGHGWRSEASGALLGSSSAVLGIFTGKEEEDPPQWPQFQTPPSSLVRLCTKRTTSWPRDPSQIEVQDGNCVLVVEVETVVVVEVETVVVVVA